MTNQEIFDKVAKHLLTQNKQARDAKGCRYKDESGLKCAVGCLIPDDKYDPRIEGMNVPGGFPLDNHATPGRKLLLEILMVIGVSASQLPLLSGLQSIHDTCAPSEWKEVLKDCAERFNLSTEVLQ